MLTKQCGICKEVLPATDEYFASRQLKTKIVLQGNCRKCHSEYRKKHYQKNKQKYIDKAKRYRDFMLRWFIDFKKTLVCKQCGEKRYWVLDFHHRDPFKKDIEVSTLVRQCNKNKILLEIEKCDVLCSNCHRDLHHKLAVDA